MDVSKRVRTIVTVTVTLEEWEAKDLSSILQRLGQSKISKSEFSLREKVTGRKLMEALR